MSCGARGICQCGRPRCAIAEWWVHWGLLWRTLAFEFSEQDDAVRYYSQLV